MSAFKQQLLATCKAVIDKKINALNEALNEVTDAGNNETKSTAGDKHETSRAMMQIEQEKLGKQIQEWEIQKNILGKINTDSYREEKTSNTISLGSLIETSRGLFFIAANVGKVKTEDKEVMVISNQSPLGICFMKHKAGDEFEFNGVAYRISRVI